MAKRKFFILIPLIIFLIFSLAGCFKKQKVETNIWPEKKDSEEDVYGDKGRLMPEEGEKEVFRVTEIPENKEDIKKLLDNLEKNSGVINLEINENELDEIEEEESGYIEDEVDEDITDRDIDEL
jgi:hypothetical protein